MRSGIYLLAGVTAIALHGCGTATTVRSQNAAAPAPLYAHMTEGDVKVANGMVQIALETAVSGTRLAWENPASGHSGSVRPIRTFKSTSGLYCRDYDETLTIEKRTERYTDTACRDSDHVWKPVAEP